MKNTIKQKALALAVISSFCAGNTYASNSTELTNDLNQKIQFERSQMPSDFEAGTTVDVEWEFTQIKIPYPRCSKHYERLSFDVPQFRKGSTKVLGMKVELPKIYNKRIEIKFDIPRCSKDYKVVKLHLPQFYNARTTINNGTDRIDALVADYQPKIEAAAIAEAKESINVERNKIVDGFEKDILVVQSEISKATDQVRLDILKAQLKMLTEMQKIVLSDFDKRVKNIG